MLLSRGRSAIDNQAAGAEERGMSVIKSMESSHTEETSTENAKVSDSGYSNTCSNSQSHTSNDSSVSRNSNRSARSSYHDGIPSAFASCTETTLPKPMLKRKDKGYKKKKSKSAALATAEIAAQSAANSAIPVPCPLASSGALAAEQSFCKPSLGDKIKKDEVAVVELVDATDPTIHNDKNLPSNSEAGLASKTIPFDESSSQFTEEYYAVVSMQDGLVLHVTSSLLVSLGYQNDTWTGRLFTDFLDPRDKNVLNERIASEIAISRDLCSAGANGQKTNIFCRLRRFSTAQPTPASYCEYVPYRVNLMVQNYHGDKLSVNRNQVMLLIASFQPVRSAYTVPEEIIMSTVFTTRHNATCHLSYIDPALVQYLGYLPQDMIDRSMFNFYYPEDLPLIKDIYETIINLESSTYKSKPYRFMVQNGGYVVLETDWSSFVNPWTKSVEFIVGQHRVLKGPADPNIFGPPCDRKNSLLDNISEEVLKEAKVIQSEILALLDKGVQRKPACPVTDCDLLSKKKELTSFVETILQEIKSPALITDHMAVDDRSFSEHDSVMLGEISPHHEYFDSKSSTETPPSYNQLNYLDNIERFFKSNIGVAANNGFYASDEENLHSSANSSDEPGKNNTSRPELKCTSSTNGSGNSGSAENLSSESNNLQSYGSQGETSNTTSNNSTSNGRFKLPLLTESRLNRHNEDMEKLIVQKHREQKKGDKRNKSSNNDQKAKATEQLPARGESNNNKSRRKRSCSQSCEGDNNFNKHARYEDSANLPQDTSQASANQKFAPASMETSVNAPKTNPNINTWPPISMPATTTITQQCFTSPNTCTQAISRIPVYPQMFPVYYVPVPQPRENPPLTTIPQEHPGPPNHMSQPAPYCYVPVPQIAAPMPAMYPPIIGPPGLASMMYRSFFMPEPVATVPPMNVMPQSSYQSTTTVPTTTAASSFDLKRPESRATSEKAEPGSTMAMSESSKKIFSPSGIVSSCVSNEGGCCFSSSINKSCGSSSNTDQRHTISPFESYQQSSDSKNQPQYHKSKGSHTSHTRKGFGMVRKEPPWIEGVKLSPELVYQYQIGSKSLGEVLKNDLEFLRHSKQPNLVNDQLGQLFFDLDLEGLGSKLIFDDVGNNASDSSSDSSQSPSRMGAW